MKRLFNTGYYVLLAFTVQFYMHYLWVAFIYGIISISKYNIVCTDVKNNSMDLCVCMFVCICIKMPNNNVIIIASLSFYDAVNLNL